MGSKVFLISHNEFAHGLKKTIEMITGEHENLYSFGLMPGGHPDDLLEEIEALIDDEDQVFILGDLAGGSVCNAALRLSILDNITLIAGMNLSLAIQIILTPPYSESELETIINDSKAGLTQLVLNNIKQNEEDFF